MIQQDRPIPLIINKTPLRICMPWANLVIEIQPCGEKIMIKKEVTQTQTQEEVEKNIKIINEYCSEVMFCEGFGWKIDESE